MSEFVCVAESQRLYNRSGCIRCGRGCPRCNREGLPTMTGFKTMEEAQAYAARENEQSGAKPTDLNYYTALHFEDVGKFNRSQI